MSIIKTQPAGSLRPSYSDSEKSESTKTSDVEPADGGALRAGPVYRLRISQLLNETATVEIYGEATKLMKETKAATILCKINSPIFRIQLEGFLKKHAADAFGVCTHHKLLTQPWSRTTTTPREESDKMPDAMLCCFRADFAFSNQKHSLLCEVSFIKNGKLLYVEEVASLGDEVTNPTNTEGESGEYLGVFRNIYETAQPFEISIQTKRPMPVVACTQFNTAKALHDELARRASYFMKDEINDKAKDE